MRHTLATLPRSFLQLEALAPSWLHTDTSVLPNSRVWKPWHRLLSNTAAFVNVHVARYLPHMLAPYHLKISLCMLITGKRVRAAPGLLHRSIVFAFALVAVPHHVSHQSHSWGSEWMGTLCCA